MLPWRSSSTIRSINCIRGVRQPPGRRPSELDAGGNHVIPAPFRVVRRDSAPTGGRVRMATDERESR